MGYRTPSFTHKVKKFKGIEILFVYDNFNPKTAKTRNTVMSDIGKVLEVIYLDVGHLPANIAFLDHEKRWHRIEIDSDNEFVRYSSMQSIQNLFKEESEVIENKQESHKKRGRGRPKGAKNKPRIKKEQTTFL